MGMRLHTREDERRERLRGEVATWLASMQSELRERGRTDAAGFARLVVRTLCDHGALLEVAADRLALEHCTPGDAAAQFDDVVRDEPGLTTVVERALALRPGDGRRIVLRCLALVLSGIGVDPSRSLTAMIQRTIAADRQRRLQQAEDDRAVPVGLRAVGPRAAIGPDRRAPRPGGSLAVGVADC